MMRKLTVICWSQTGRLSSSPAAADSAEAMAKAIAQRAEAAGA